MTSQTHFEPREQIEILGLPVDRVTMEQALQKIENFLKTSQHHLVITADASGLVQAQDDTFFQQLFREAALITPDGAGILWAARRQGTPLAERVSGVDLVEKMAKLSSEKGYRIYFLGSAPGIAELAAKRLTEKYPGAQIVGARDGYFKPEQDEEIARQIAETKPDVLFVAMGIPRQEKFIYATSHIIGAKVSMGVGGSFDVHSGTVKRAPVVMQKLKLEWLWRLLLNPKKISKVKLLPIFVKLVLSQKGVPKPTSGS